jgi:hypothetical protein
MYYYGEVQPFEDLSTGGWVGHPPVRGFGIAMDEDQAREQLISLWGKTYPKIARSFDNTMVNYPTRIIMHEDQERLKEALRKRGLDSWLDNALLA